MYLVILVFVGVINSYFAVVLNSWHPEMGAFIML
uniref:Uncharacterized protein n=1 Tax=Siphoviridae sp. ct0zh2 TaxID=2825302 RepID=A0A8S5PM50_9CAUD|nr:MAG TPA: hypothetical protein [Siphoviridae sp. ct0zh2]